MRKILPFRMSRQRQNEIAAEKQAEKEMFLRVLDELKEKKGIDYMKLLTGDPEENLRFQNKLAQEARDLDEEEL